jgi:hypothetical protein
MDWYLTGMVVVPLGCAGVLCVLGGLWELLSRCWPLQGGIRRRHKSPAGLRHW